MTLADFFAIFWTRRRLCLTVIGATLLLSIAWYRLQIQSYEASLLLSVVRTNAPATAEYRYDQFYRLQADERFADTLVRYLGTEQAKRDVIGRAGLSSGEAAFVGSRSIAGKRLSSQLIEVTLPARTLRGGEKLSSALPETLNQYAENLNREARDPDWFAVLSSEPVIRDTRLSWRLALLGGLLLGSFVAFWLALFDHYWRREGRDHADRH